MPRPEAATPDAVSSERALVPARRHPEDIGARFMARLLGGVLVGLVLLLVLAWRLFPATVQDRRFALPVPTMPAPRLQTDPPHDMRRFLAEERRWLDGTGWVDRPQGIVHIPIAQAMREVAREGIPGWPAPPGGRPGPAGCP
jgi:hypothetical protein